MIYHVTIVAFLSLFIIIINNDNTRRRLTRADASPPAAKPRILLEIEGPGQNLDGGRRILAQVLGYPLQNLVKILNLQ